MTDVVSSERVAESRLRRARRWPIVLGVLGVVGFLFLFFLGSLELVHYT